MKRPAYKQSSSNKTAKQSSISLRAKVEQSSPPNPIPHPVKKAALAKRPSEAKRKPSAKPKQLNVKSSAASKKPYSKLPPKAKNAAGKPRTKAKQSAPRTEAQYLARPEKFKEAFDRVLSVISKMRSEKVSLTQASREAGISPRTVTKWGKSALRKQPSGKYAAKASDNLLRLVMIPTPQGTREIAVRGSKQVTLLAKYSNALHRYLQTGDASKLKEFQGMHIKDANGVDVPLLVDLATLNHLGSAGVLSFESLYARSA